MPATHPYIPRIAFIFDFDKTLASDTIDGMCAVWGLSREEWEERFHDPLGDNWDGILKRGLACIHAGRELGQPLTRDFFDRAARELTLYDGVRELPGRLREAASELLPDAEVEMVVLSSGYIEMIERTDVDQLFDKTWAGGFHFDENGEAVWMKRLLGHPEKARYIEAYAKGLDLDTANEPRVDDPGFSEMDMRVPFDQLAYIGDGLSDLEAFGFVTNHGGLAIAIDKSAQSGSGDFDYSDQQTTDERVDNLASPDFSEGTPLLESLCNAARSAASRAAIRKFSEGE